MNRHEANWLVYGMVELLEKERRENGRTARDVARQIGVNEKTLREMENGVREPNAGNLLAYAYTMGYEIVMRKK